MVNATNKLNRADWDLEKRTQNFARKVREFVKKLPRSVANMEDTKQVVRSSGSIGANYIEANESMSKKDFIMRLKISLKEAKETRYWLELIDCGESKSTKDECAKLASEATEYLKIMNAIITKSQ
ncbi:MAG TPA: four helix bundle protein [Candidatus Paceibacterota bacterium]